MNVKLLRFRFCRCKDSKKREYLQQKSKKIAYGCKNFSFLFRDFKKNDYLCKRYPEYNLFTLKKTNTY